MVPTIEEHARRMEKQRDRWRSVAEQAEKALRFYADVSKYPVPKTGGLGELYFDCGETAKEALSAFDSLRKEGK